MSDWRAFANCTGEDTELFFAQNAQGYAKARRICAGCDVRDECLADALASEHEDSARHGMFGGLLPRERGDLASGAMRGRANERALREAAASSAVGDRASVTQPSTAERRRVDVRRMPWERRELGGRTHGYVATYNAGCRCGECRDAARMARRAYRRRAS